MNLLSGILVLAVTAASFEGSVGQQGIPPHTLVGLLSNAEAAQLYSRFPSNDEPRNGINKKKSSNQQVDISIEITPPDEDNEDDGENTPKGPTGGRKRAEKILSVLRIVVKSLKEGESLNPAVKKTVELLQNDKEASNVLFSLAQTLNLLKRKKDGEPVNRPRPAKRLVLTEAEIRSLIKGLSDALRVNARQLAAILRPLNNKAKMTPEFLEVIEELTRSGNDPDALAANLGRAWQILSSDPDYEEALLGLVTLYDKSNNMSLVPLSATLPK